MTPETITASDRPAGTPLSPEAALRALAEELDGRAARRAVRGAAEAVAGGAHPAAALGDVSAALPADVAGLPAVLKDVPGDAVPPVLTAAARAAGERAADLRRAKWTVLWPVALAAATAAASLAALALVVPGVAELFESFGVAVPAATRAVIAAGQVVRDGWWAAVPVGAAVAAVAAYFAVRPTAGRTAFAPLLRQAEQARACDLLAASVAGRLPLPAGLSAAAATTGDRRLSFDLTELAGRVREGVPAADAAGVLDTIPPVFRTALRWEGTPDALADALAGAAAVLRAKADVRLSPAGLFSALLQPMLVLVIAGVVGTAFGLLIYPMIDLLNDLS